MMKMIIDKYLGFINIFFGYCNISLPIRVKKKNVTVDYKENVKLDVLDLSYAAANEDPEDKYKFIGTYKDSKAVDVLYKDFYTNSLAQETSGRYGLPSPLSDVFGIEMFCYLVRKEIDKLPEKIQKLRREACRGKSNWWEVSERDALAIVGNLPNLEEILQTFETLCFGLEDFGYAKYGKGSFYFGTDQFFQFITYIDEDDAETYPELYGFFPQK